MIDPRHPFFTLITDLGDSLLLGGVALLTALYLMLTGSRRAGLLLLAAFVTAAGLIGVLKILFYDCGYRIPGMEIRSPSGHAALSCAVWGMIAAIAARQFIGWRRALPFLFAAPLIALIAWTRTALGYHTPEEVYAGLLAGGAVAFCCILLLRRTPRRRFSLPGALLVVLAAIIALHGTRAPAENFIRALGAWLKPHLPICAMEK